MNVCLCIFQFSTFTCRIFNVDNHMGLHILSYMCVWLVSIITDSLHKQARFVKTYVLFFFFCFFFFFFAFDFISFRCMSVFYPTKLCLVLSRRMFGIVVRLALILCFVYFVSSCVFVFRKKKNYLFFVNETKSNLFAFLH